MAFNGAGVFNRVHNWTQDAANGINIMADRMDAEDSGFAAGLSICLTRDGQSIMQAPLDMAGFKILRLGSPTLNTDAVNLSYFKDNPVWTIDGSNILSFDTQPVFGAGFKVGGNFPQIIFEEEDQTDPAGRWRLVADLDNFYLQKATVAGGFGTPDTVWRVLGGATKRLEVMSPYTMGLTTFSGLVTMNAGASFGSAVAPGGATDLSRHIALFGDTYGISITGAAFNVVANGSVDFYPGGSATALARIDGSGRVLARNTNGVLSMHGWIGMVDSGMYRWTDTSIAFGVLGTQTMWMTATNVVVPTGIGFQAQNGMLANDVRVGLDSAGVTGVINKQGATGGLALRAGSDGFVQVQSSNGVTNYARFEVNGTGVPNAVSVVTREKGDFRYASASSQRFKTDIAVKDEASLIAAFDALTVKSWTWGGEIASTDERFGQPGIGLIAEEVVAVLPEAGRYLWDGNLEADDAEVPTPVFDEEGNEVIAPHIPPELLNPGLVLHGLDPLALIGVLVVKIKQLEARLDAL